VVEFSKPKEWHELRAATEASGRRLLFTKAEAVLFWGAPDTLRELFPDVRKISEYDLSLGIGDIQNNLPLKGFLEEALARALVKDRALIARTRRSSSNIIVDPHHPEQGIFTALHEVAGKVAGPIVGLTTPIDIDHPNSEQVHYAECAKIGISFVSERVWLTLDPDIWIWPIWAKEFATEFLDERRAPRFNNVYDAIFEAWVRVLRGDEAAEEISISLFGAGTGAENPVFRLGLHGAFARKL
jgi:hypothetical protein